MELEYSASTMGTLVEDNQLVERMAIAYHELWMHWTIELAGREYISGDRLRRWEAMWKPYAQLTDSEKSIYESMARQALQSLR